jgi:methylase of polypeptide subunit release factors
MSAGTEFKDKLKALNFSFFSPRTNAGVIFVDRYDKAVVEHPNLLFGLEIAGKKYNADAVYFRSLRDSVIPQVYIFDYTTKILTQDERNKVHIKMWNGFQAPVYIIVEKDLVSVFDSRQKPNSSRENYAEAMFKLAANELNSFNAGRRFDSGLFWEDVRLKSRFNLEDSATRDLIRGLKSVYEDFRKKSNLDRHIALKLLIQSLLIKYLEERDENEENGYFTRNYFNKHFRCKNFCEVIRAGKLLDLLDRLSADFNGKIFLWDKDTQDGAEARRAVKKTSVNCLADYLDGNIQDEQFVLWRLYSFSYLPVEIISSVYEELLTDSKDIVYTPGMIVDVMVDECMPLSKPMEDFKLIDVSCGSGIFLVKAYKRIIQWWRYEQWKKTGVLVKPPLEKLTRLLETSIYGIDIQQDAVNLAVFSLALAMLDEVNLNPPTWEKLKFPNLSNNIAQKNFFHYIMSRPLKEFDLVIGNPPFNLPKERIGEKEKEPKRKNYFGELKNEIKYKTEIPIPDESPALHFLAQSMKLLKPDAQLCLIQPSGPFLYQNTEFSQIFFSQYNLLEIIDFTKLSDVLWRKKKVATVAVFIQNSPPDKNDVLHIIANRLSPNIKQLFLEFDYYDFYHVDKESVGHNPHVWKANLLGGGQRLLLLIERLSQLSNFKTFLKSKVKNHGWKYAEGYVIGNKKEKADYISNKRRIVPEKFTDRGVEETDIETETHFYRSCKKSKEIFLSPHIVIKESVESEKIPLDFLDYDAVFSHHIIGLHAPRKEISELERIYNIFRKNNSLFLFYIMVISGSIKIGRVTAFIKKDIDHLPFPEDQGKLKISQADQILINDIINFQLQEKGELLEKVTKKHLMEFANIFCKTLNSVYKADEKSFRLFKILDAGEYFALHIVYGTDDIQPEIESAEYLEQYIQSIIPTRKSKYDTVHVQKIIKIYGKDVVILAKPNQLRYWLLSIALRDADESFADYVEARYSNAKR